MVDPLDRPTPEQYVILEPKTIHVNPQTHYVLKGQLVVQPDGDAWVSASWTPNHYQGHYDGGVTAYVAGSCAGAYDLRLGIPSTTRGRFDLGQPHILLPRHLKGLAGTVNAAIARGQKKLTALEAARAGCGSRQDL